MTRRHDTQFALDEDEIETLVDVLDDWMVDGGLPETVAAVSDLRGRLMDRLVRVRRQKALAAEIERVLDERLRP